MTSHEGPFFDDLSAGDVFDTAPALTLTAGRAAVHQSILGSRLRLSLDSQLSRRVTGVELADPSLVWDVAIGQSTLATRRVVANLFYRGLSFHRLPAIGDTLHTRTEIVGLRQNSSRPTGLAALRITTCDQDDRLVLDFWRCAMLPLSHPEARTGHTDDLSAIGVLPDHSADAGSSGTGALAAAVAAWELKDFPPSDGAAAGAMWTLQAGDLVSSTTELDRLSLNLAHVHHDRYSQDAGRLVYGGHTIGIALAQLSRTLPNLLTIAGWHSCDHTGPVREGDTLTSSIEVLEARSWSREVNVLTLRILVFARRNEAEPTQVLDWKLTALTL